MTSTRALPEFWYPIARMLLILKALLMATSPDAFAAIAARVHRDLLLTAALVRRYLFALARTMTVPALRIQTARSPETDGETRAPCRRTCSFRVIERAPVSRSGAASEPSTPYVEWALALQRVEALLAAMRRPEPLARRLAFRLARHTSPRLRDLPVRAHVLRAIPPAFDTLLMQLDALARPEAWAGIDPDSG